jgi:hypothetical protein
MMQENKNKRLIILLVVLMTATVLVYFVTRQQETPSVNKQIFRTEDFSRIDHVQLVSKSSQIDLTFNGSRWAVNKNYDADRNMIDVLFATLQQAEPKRPLATSQQDSMRNILLNDGIKVTLLSKGQQEKVFHVGGNAAKTQAYFLDPQRNMVYLMAIPGYRVYVSGIFEMDESGWRDKYVFGFNWRNFQGLAVEFPGKSEENFSVARAGSYFGIPGIEAIDTARLNTFLDQVSLLTVDRYSDSKAITDSLLNAKPVMVITVKDIANREFPLRIYPPAKGGNVPAVISASQLTYFQRQKIQPILRPKSFFIKNQ